MNLLSAIPVWLYFVMLALTFMGAHVLAYRPNAVPSRPGLATAARVGASILLLIALIVVQPDAPGSILLAIGAAVAGGIVSGRSTPPPAAKKDEARKPGTGGKKGA
jgi:hypothetical protein